MPSGKKQNEMEIFPNPLDKEWSFDGDSTQPSDFASSPKGLEPSESTDDMKPGEAKAKIAGEDMQALFDQIPLEQMNTSMTINATAPWLLALYVAVAERQGVNPSQLQGTTQNDVLKEYLSRGTYIFPPEPSVRLTTDLIAYTVENIPKWNPTNVCSYHLQEAGATPTQELAYALATAIAILDAVKASGQIACSTPTTDI